MSNPFERIVEPLDPKQPLKKFFNLNKLEDVRYGMLTTKGKHFVNIDEQNLKTHCDVRRYLVSGEGHEFKIVLENKILAKFNSGNLELHKYWQDHNIIFSMCCAHKNFIFLEWIRRTRQKVKVQFLFSAILLFYCESLERTYTDMSELSRKIVQL